ncbi:hypothetical protein BS78_09G200600 [Paspalum vaginatum]|nr:hypothetical protein BS78_09G200600 [Paspalum vaginatum]
MLCIIVIHSAAALVLGRGLAHQHAPSSKRLKHAVEERQHLLHKRTFLWCATAMCSLATDFPSRRCGCGCGFFPDSLLLISFSSHTVPLSFNSRLRRRRLIAAVPPSEVLCGWSSASSPVSLLVAMDGGTSTNCSFTAIQQCSSRITCDPDLLASFHKSMSQKVWQLDALLLSGAILAAVIVGIGVFGQRYRHHRFTRFIFLGATTLFLPVVSTVVSMGRGDNGNVIDQIGPPYVGLAASCDPDSILVTVWASLVQIIMINTSAVVAVTDREGTYIGPPLDLLVQVFWTFYVGASYLVNVNKISITEPEDLLQISSEAIPFALTCAKIVFKYYAFHKARRSFALGNNPHLIFAYMQQPPPRAGTREREPMAAVDEDVPPPLVVMGEKKSHVVNKPHGYVFKDFDSSVTTVDRVWSLDTSIFPMSTLRRLQDLCLSFAMFKLLRCRFARYNVTSAPGSNNDNFTFFWSLLLKDRGHERVFKLISDEISFVHDYYYSSLPISYSRSWLPIMDLFISLLSISYCISAATSLIILIVNSDRSLKHYYPQISCTITCNENRLQSGPYDKEFGSLYFDLVPIFILLVFVVISEVREMASYICGNWTKVALVCRLLNGGTSQHYLCMQKCADFVLRHKCKLMRHWDQKIGQCSVLMLQPRATAPRVLLWRLFHLPDQKRKIKVPEAAKVCIIEALRNTSRNGHLSNGTACLHRRGQVGQRFLWVWACDNKSTSCTILTWHIATSILEVRYPNVQDDQEQQCSSSSVSNTSYKTVATILSRYCAYLVTWCPELLPDDEAWSQSLYEDVKKVVASALAGCAAAGSLTPEARCQQLIDSIEKAEQDESKNGARLGKQLVELMVEAEDTAAAWKLVAEFWSEMILYVAPSNNFKGHKEAIARGGELITLLWVLLFHAGIVSRPG